MKIKNALLLIVISLFFGIGNVFASEIHFWDLSSSSHNHTDYRLALLTGTNEYNTISVTLSTYGYNPTVFTINSSDLNTTSFSFGQPIENSSLNVTEYKHHLYFYNNGKLSGSIDDLGTLTMSNSNEYDMSTFPGRVEEINIKLRVCEKDPNPMLDGVYYDVNGNIVSEAEYISSCKSSDSGSTDGDDIGNTGDTGGGEQSLNPEKIYI